DRALAAANGQPHSGCLTLWAVTVHGKSGHLKQSIVKLAIGNNGARNAALESLPLDQLHAPPPNHVPSLDRHALQSLLTDYAAQALHRDRTPRRTQRRRLVLQPSSRSPCLVNHDLKHPSHGPETTHVVPGLPPQGTRWTEKDLEDYLFKYLPSMVGTDLFVIGQSSPWQWNRAAMAGGTPALPCLVCPSVGS